MNKTISTSLYIGIIADTGRFLYPSTTSKTYEIVSKLVKIGVDREKVHNAMYQKDKSFYLLTEAYTLTFILKLSGSVNGSTPSLIHILNLNLSICSLLSKLFVTVPV